MKEIREGVAYYPKSSRLIVLGFVVFIACQWLGMWLIYIDEPEPTPMEQCQDLCGERGVERFHESGFNDHCACQSVLPLECP